MKIKIILATPYKGNINGHLSTANSLKSSLVKLGFEVCELDQPTRYNFSLVKYLKYIRDIFLSIKKNKNKVNVFYIFLHRSRISFYFKDLPLFVAAILSNSKIIIHLIGNDFNKFIFSLLKIERLFIVFIFYKVSTWVVLGKKMKENISLFLKNNKLNKKIIINPGLCEYIKHKPVNKIRHKEIVVSYMSNLIYEKGIVIFLKSIIDLVENYNINIKVKIAGTTQTAFKNDLVDSAVREAQTKSYISFVGVITGISKWKFLSSSQIFILPTSYPPESLPLVLVDAMRSGCYCISTPIGEIKYLLSKNRGALIKNLSEKNLKKKILEAINNPALIKKKTFNAQKFIQNNFNQLKYNQNIIKTLYSVIT
jgi:glycosyltransferase involved in cell wall biosynthesis